MVRPVWGRPRQQTKGKCYTLTNSFCLLLWWQTDSNSHSTMRLWRVFVPRLKPMCAQQKRPRACRVYLMCEGTGKEPAADGSRSRFPSELAAFVHTYLPAYTCMHTMRALFAVDLCLVHTCSALCLFFFHTWRADQSGRLVPFSSALNLLRRLCLYASCPLHLSGSDAKIHKGFNSQTADEESERKERKEEERRGDGHHTLSTITETSSLLSLSFLSGRGSLRKYSRDLYLLLYRWLFFLLSPTSTPHFRFSV